MEECSNENSADTTEASLENGRFFKIAEVCCQNGTEENLPSSSAFPHNIQLAHQSKKRKIDQTVCGSSQPNVEIHEECDDTKVKAIDTHQYFEEKSDNWADIEGRRIVEFNYVMKCVVRAQAHHSKSCPGVLCLHQEYYQSMVSIMWFKCDECKIMFKVRTEQPSERPKLRKSVVWGTLCSGGTYTQTKQLLSFCDIPFMPVKTFSLDEMEMDTTLQEAVDESTNKAVEDEKATYFEELEASNQNAPPDQPVKIKASLDGSWATRSYGTRYSSASGCGVIVGEKTAKIIHVGCRNKRCSVCTRNSRRNNEKGSHKCYRNYVGSSGGMEPDIMIEGFQELERKGVWITTLITDGDSTTVARIKNAIKYGPSIEHQLCCNHVCKNMGKKLRDVSYLL
ncbi:uncharacterized protein LOC134285453 isoform X2 [Aedes albopictus]|uniref:Mutator-like transposase domain-containing protein n=1 Tax=Aedes albopictus TaxID=7160 RepID=A0ABM1Y0N8_AEDAL